MKIQTSCLFVTTGFDCGLYCCNKLYIVVTSGWSWLTDIVANKVGFVILFLLTKYLLIVKVDWQS